MSLNNQGTTKGLGGEANGRQPEGRPEGNGEAGRYGWLKRSGIYYALCMEMTFSIAGATLLGWWLDTKFDTTPWLTIVLLILGVAAAIRFLFVLLRRLGGGDDAREER